MTAPPKLLDELDLTPRDLDDLGEAAELAERVRVALTAMPIGGPLPIDDVIERHAEAIGSTREAVAWLGRAFLLLVGLTPLVAAKTMASFAAVTWMDETARLLKHWETIAARRLGRPVQPR